MRQARRFPALRATWRLLAVALLGGGVWVSGCGDGATEPPSTPDLRRPTTVTVTPATAQLVTLDATVQLTAQVRDQNGEAMPGATVTWASADTAVATVSSVGLVTAVGNGKVSIAARTGSASGTATVTVVDFTALLRVFADRHGIGAAALAVMKNGEIVNGGAVGFMDAERQVSIRQDVMMRLASVSKPITAAAIRTLANAGRLALDDRVFELGQGEGGLLHFDPFPQLGDSRLADVTVLHLLQHRGGWDRETAGDLTYREIEIADAMSISSPPGRENTVRYILGQPLQFAPGSRRAYSNIGYLVLGLIVEEASGQDYITYVRENIFTPLDVPAGDVIQGRTFPEARSDREPWYDGEGFALNVYDPSGPLVRWPDGGWDHEARIAQGGLVASTRAILAFLDAYQVAGDDIGRRRRGGEGEQWWWYHTGSLSGTNTLALQRGNGINYVALFNRRASRGDPSYAGLFREAMEELLAELAGTAMADATSISSISMNPAKPILHR